MNKKEYVKASLENGSVKLQLRYDDSIYDDRAYVNQLAEELRTKYKELREKNHETSSPNCRLEMTGIRSSSSGINNAIYDLFDEVRAHGGELDCIGFPREYVEGLETIGLTNEEGFKLSLN